MTPCVRCGRDVGFLGSAGDRCSACKAHVEKGLAAWSQRLEWHLRDGYISPEEETDLRSFQHQLALYDADMGPVVWRLHRAKQLFEVQQGRLPHVPLQGFFLPPHEIPHFVSQSNIRMTVHSKAYERGHSGASIRLTRGVHWHVGGSRGHWVTESHAASVSGIFIVTSLNVRFIARSAPITLPLQAVLAFNYGADAVELFYEGKPGDEFFQVSDGELAAATIHVARGRLGWA